MKRRCLLPAALVAIALAGCAGGSSSTVESQTVTYTEPTTVIPVNDHTFLAESSSVFVTRSGKITSMDVESFSEQYYSVDELKKEYVEPAVANYNSAGGEDKVKLVSLDKKNDKAYLQLEFASTADYLSFNKTNNKYFENWKIFDVCDYAKISEAGYALPSELTDEWGSVVSSSRIKTDVELHVCVIDLGTGYPSGFSGSFVFEGDVAYVSSGITIETINSVKIADASGLQYIIFK